MLLNYLHHPVEAFNGSFVPFVSKFNVDWESFPFYLLLNATTQLLKKLSISCEKKNLTHAGMYRYGKIREVF